MPQYEECKEKAPVTSFDSNCYTTCMNQASNKSDSNRMRAGSICDKECTTKTGKYKYTGYYDYDCNSRIARKNGWVAE